MAVLALVALFTAGCGGKEPSLADLPRKDPGPIHVHGLGIDPADRSLFIATHTGLWRLGASSGRAVRVTNRRQDTMGFSVIGPNHFLGSGHPDIREARERGLPSHLGLIESRDAGRSWRSISLGGLADFHILRSAGSFVYGFDSRGGRFLVSRDAGEGWEERRLPGYPIDLAVDPNQPTRLLLTTGRGLFVSPDAGLTWRNLGQASGLLAWPQSRHVVVVTLSGLVLAGSPDRHAFRSVGHVGAEPAALLASEHGLFVALHDGTIKRSNNGGARWTIRARP